MNKLSKPKQNYTILDNRIHEMTNLSAAARYLWIYLMGRPDNWEVRTSQISTVVGFKAQTVRKLYRELIDANLLTVTRKNSGHCVYTLHGITTGEIITRENVTREKVTRIINTERATNTERAIKPLVKLAFDRWWESYPKKKAKQDALKAFTAVVQNKSAEKIESFADHIIADTKNRAANEESWQREGGRYIPNGATYIRGQRYKDAITRATPKVAALPTDMDALGKFAVEHNLHAPGQAPQTIRNAYEYRSWIQERLQANTNV
jgi:hypothetical protein